jgi:hypothetical protein
MVVLKADSDSSAWGTIEMVIHHAGSIISFRKSRDNVIYDPGGELKSILLSGKTYITRSNLRVLAPSYF